MVIRWQETARWGLGVLGSLLAILGLGFASQLWAAKEELQGSVQTIKAERASDHDLLLDLRDEQREMRRDIKEILHQGER